MTSISTWGGNGPISQSFVLLTFDYLNKSNIQLYCVRNIKQQSPAVVKYKNGTNLSIHAILLIAQEKQSKYSHTYVIRTAF